MSKRIWVSFAWVWWFDWGRVGEVVGMVVMVGVTEVGGVLLMECSFGSGWVLLDAGSVELVVNS